MDALFAKCWKVIRKKEYAYPFMAAVIVGLITHMFLFVNKLPNADAMTSFYFDQNMVTSGRWFLTVVCGISSYYDLNWVIGILSILYVGVAAVIDKDLSSAKLAIDLKADKLVILTAVEKVCINFNTPNQKALDHMTTKEAYTYIDQNQFAAGSMLPKVRACIEFVEKTNNYALITSLEKAKEALNNQTGTKITL